MIQARLRGADYRNVTLLDSPFRSQRDETIALYLEHPSNDDILHRYRLRAGIPSHVDGMVGSEGLQRLEVVDADGDVLAHIARSGIARCDV